MLLNPYITFPLIGYTPASFPFLHIISKEKLILKSDSDLNVQETQKRAENEAVILALIESGDKIVEFLNE